MGLDATVGAVADLSDIDDQTYEHELLDAVNEALREAGVPEHHEPTGLEPLWYRVPAYVQPLRRLAAHLWAGLPLPPPADPPDPVGPVLTAYYESEGTASPTRRIVQRFDHLVLHGDAVGVYVPADFAEVIIPRRPELQKRTGWAIGSSPRLGEECRRVAAVLKLPLELDPDSDEVLDPAPLRGDRGPIWQRYELESRICLCLYRLATYSVQTGAAIVFYG